VKPVRLVTVPASDDAFARDARAAAARIPPSLAHDDAIAWFETELRGRYPTAVVRAQVDLAKPHPDIGALWYVFRREYRSRISKSVHVPLRVDETFALYVDRVVEWQSAVELKPLQRSGHLVGDEYSATYRLLGQEFHGSFRIVDADPPRSLTTEAGGSGIRVWYVTRFAAEPDGGTRVTVEGDYDLPEGIVPRIADRLFIERAIDRDIEGAHATFASLCEAVWRGRADRGDDDTGEAGG
jgi:Polyketide cyclase / dehydrase and lipid transport